MPKLAVEGGDPIRADLLPYARQTIEADDIQAVVEALGSDWLTTGPRVGELEKAFAKKTGSRQAVALSSGTAALHAAAHAAGIGPGDEVIVPAMTFVATANCALYCGATPVPADVDPDSLLIDPKDVEKKITPRTKAVIAMDYAGQPCDYDRLRGIASGHKLTLIADACHSLGASYKKRSAGTLADLNVFSFHAVKHIATGEGGMVTCESAETAQRLRQFRNHGIASDHWQREKTGSWVYDMAELGFNYRITDFQCALGLSQLAKLDRWLERRRYLAAHYTAAFNEMPELSPLESFEDRQSAWHLYVIRLHLECWKKDRQAIFAALRAEKIGVNVHYIPLHRHSYYRDRFGWNAGMCPAAENAYERIITLPLYPGMSDSDADDVIAAVRKVKAAYT